MRIDPSCRGRHGSLANSPPQRRFSAKRGRCVHCYRRHSRTHRGFTLVELLVAVVVTSALLVGLSVVVRQVSAGAEVSPWRQFEGRYHRAMQVIEADVRGLVRLTPLPAQRTEHGRAVAGFVTTHRVDALGERGWRGSAQVDYWIEQTPEQGQVLWRGESTSTPAPGRGAPGSDASDNQEDMNGASSQRTWMPLVRGLDQLSLRCRLEGQWRRWPRGRDDDASPEARCRGVRIEARRSGDAMQRGRALPTRTFTPFGRQMVDLGQARDGRDEVSLDR